MGLEHHHNTNNHLPDPYSGTKTKAKNFSTPLGSQVPTIGKVFLTTEATRFKIHGWFWRHLRTIIGTWESGFHHYIKQVFYISALLCWHSKKAQSLGLVSTGYLDTRGRLWMQYRAHNEDHLQGIEPLVVILTTSTETEGYKKLLQDTFISLRAHLWIRAWSMLCITTGWIEEIWSWPLKVNSGNRFTL